ncbi:MAG: DUF1150 family protein [Rhodospirillales bacterium]|nr:DUF1150 family protein [Rhodospirillales bacterium]
MIENQKTLPQNLRNISPQDFLSYGMQGVAYVRKIQVDEREGFAVHAADGTPLSVMDSLQEALYLIHHNDMDSALLH